MKLFTIVIMHLNVREEGGGLDVEAGRDTTAYKSPEAGWRWGSKVWDVWDFFYILLTWWREGECGEMPTTLPPPASGGVTAALSDIGRGDVGGGDVVVDIGRSC